jgi:hypothetical protein
LVLELEEVAGLVVEVDLVGVLVVGLLSSTTNYT